MCKFKNNPSTYIIILLYCMHAGTTRETQATCCIQPCTNLNSQYFDIDETPQMKTDLCYKHNNYYYRFPYSPQKVITAYNMAAILRYTATPSATFLENTTKLLTIITKCRKRHKAIILKLISLTVLFCRTKLTIILIAS